MRFSLTGLLLLFTLSLLAQRPTGHDGTHQLERLSNAAATPALLKSPCTGGESGIRILSCEGELPDTGDNDPGDGAFMTWTATGSNNLYFSQIYNEEDTFRIVRTGTNLSVYEADDDGEYTATLSIGGGANGCLDAGDWTVRVWDVQDADGNQWPDSLGGEIIGCYTECTFSFQPSCDDNTNSAVDARVTNVACGPNTGAIRITSVRNNRFYCSDELNYQWAGPDGFTSTERNIDDLAAGTYTLTITDTYGCPNVSTIMVGEDAPLDVQCAQVSTTSRPGQEDGEISVTVDGAGGFVDIAYDGPDSGTRRDRRNGTTNIPRLPAGDYTITVTDRLNDCEYTCMVTVEDPPCEVDFTIAYTATPDGVTEVVITPTGGMDPFSLTYSGPNGTGPSENFIGSGGRRIPGDRFTFGTYTFTMIEQTRQDCGRTITLDIAPPDCSSLSVTPVRQMRPTCNGGSDGTLEIAIAGGSNPTVVWSGPGVEGATATTLTMLTAGTYTYTVSDAQGCTVSDNYTLLDSPPLGLSCTASPITRNGAQDGRITIEFTGGINPVDLSYTATAPGGGALPGGTQTAISSGFTLDNLEAGNYSIVLTDDRGCSDNCTAVIIEPAVCSIDVMCAATDPTVAGGDGSATIQFTGPDPSRSYFVFNADTGAEITSDLAPDVAYILTDLPPGNYRVEASNFGGCTGECRFTINNITCGLRFVNVQSGPVACTDENTGSLSFAVEGANDPVELDWSDDRFDGTNAATGLAPGSYSVTATDAAGCSEVLGPLAITNPPPVTVELAQEGTIDCAGGTTVTLRATPAGALGAVTYRWSDPSFPDAPVVAGVGAGTYWVEVTDGNGCGGAATRETITVAEPEPFSITCDATAESIVGAADGSVSFTTEGGAVPFMSIELNSTSVTRPIDDTFTDLPPGEYRVDIVDANGCPATCTATVNPGGCGAFAVEVVATQPNCDDPSGSITATPLAPNGLVTYAWDNGATTATIDGLAAGEYCVTATDAQGCEAGSRCATIAPFTGAPTVVFGSFSQVCEANCTTIDIALTGTPPFTLAYTLDRAGSQVQGTVEISSSSDTGRFCPADFGVSDFRASTFTFTSLTGGAGCAQMIEEVRAIVWSGAALSTIDTTVCSGATLEVAGELFGAGRPSGEVTLPGAAASGCDSIITVGLTFAPEATGVFSEQLCTGEERMVGTERFTEANPSGTVVLPGASSTGCDSTVTVSLTYLAPAAAQLNETLCAGDTLRFAGSEFFAGNTSGEVILPGAAVGGCDSVVLVNVDFVPAARGTFSATVCPGDSVVYAGERFAFDRPTGEVRLPGVAARGCDSIITVTVDFFATAMSTLDTTVCPGSVVTVGGRTFSEPITDAVVQIPNPASGCDSIVVVNVSNFEPPTVVLSGDGLVCNGGAVELGLAYTGPGVANVTVQSSLGETYALVTGSGTQSVDAPPGATLTIATATGPGACPIETSGSVTVQDQSPSVAITIAEDPTADCNDPTYAGLRAEATNTSGEISYQWSTGADSMNITDVPGASYSVTITDQTGCTATSTVDLPPRQGLVLITDTVVPTCLNSSGSIIIREVARAVPPLLYRVDDADFTLVDSLPDTLTLGIGTFTLEVEDAAGCRATSTFDLTAPPTGTLTIAPPRAVVPFGDSTEVRLVTNLETDSFFVSPGPDTLLPGANMQLFAFANQEYTFSVVDDRGCSATATFNLISDPTSNVYVPTAFSPNDDGNNDRFELFPNAQVASVLDFKVYDRWGGEVFSVDGPFDPRASGWGWAGNTADNTPYPNGVYVYSATVSLRNGREIDLRGQIHLIR